jgi:hypothetical protein
VLSKVESPRRVLAVAAPLVLPHALAASGNGVGTGQAAEVDGNAISVKQVDDLARVICATQSGQQSQGGKSPTAAVRAIALNVLIGIEVGAGVGDLGSADRQQVAQSVQSAAQARALVDEDDRALFDQVVEDSTRSQLVLNQEAAKRLQASGGDPTDQNALQAEVAKVQADYVKKADVKVSTRFGRLENGQLIAGDGSLSVPVSKTATAATGGSSDDPFGTASTADVPASQRCS